MENKESYEAISVALCDVLRRNPQHLTPVTMQRLKESIKRDGFVAPILVRPIKGDRFEVVSGNHRFMAARELGHATVPAVIKEMSDDQMQRLALNLNLIHGDPTAEQLAPFLAELSDSTLSEIHLGEDLLSQIETFDAELGEKLRALEVPDALATQPVSAEVQAKKVECPKCHHSFRA